MAKHKDCKLGDDLITLNEIALLIGMSAIYFRQFSGRINMPAPAIIKGNRKFYNRNRIIAWIEKTDPKAVICKVRREIYLATEGRAAKTKATVDQQLVSKFLTGGFDPASKQAERLAKIEAAKAAKPKTIVLSAIVDNDGELIKRVYL